MVGGGWEAEGAFVFAWQGRLVAVLFGSVVRFWFKFNVLVFLWTF
jgi:hypothetical protein